MRVRPNHRVPWTVGSLQRSEWRPQQIVASLERPNMNDPVFQPVLALDKLREGRMHACHLGEREIVLCRTADGVYALDNVCTHAFARMNEGRLRGTRLICPLHGASFDVRDGRVLAAPAMKPLVSHTVRVVSGTIEVAISPDAPPPAS